VLRLWSGLFSEYCGVRRVRTRAGCRLCGGRVCYLYRHPTGVSDAHAHSDTYCHGIVYGDSDTDSNDDEHPNGHHRPWSG